MVIKPTRNRVIIKIPHQAVEDIYSKQIVKDDGSIVRLVTGMRHELSDAASSKDFVRTGEVVAVGRGVVDVDTGDIAILDYLVSNSPEIMVHKDKEASYFSVYAQTTYEPEDVVIPENRKRDKPMYVARKGEVNEVSQIIGLIRGNFLIAKDPYVLLSFVPQEQDAVTASGIMYKEKKEVTRHEILAVSPFTTEKFGYERGMNVCVNYTDAFEIVLPEPIGRIIAINDIDILAEDILFVK